MKKQLLLREQDQQFSETVSFHYSLPENCNSITVSAVVGQTELSQCNMSALR